MILTDEEIMEAIGDPCATPQMMDDARAIEKAVIEKLAPIQLKQDERWRRLKDGQFIAEYDVCPECSAQSTRDFGPNCKMCGCSGHIAVPAKES